MQCELVSVVISYYTSVVCSSVRYSSKQYSVVKYNSVQCSVIINYCICMCRLINMTWHFSRQNNTEYWTVLYLTE